MQSKSKLALAYALIMAETHRPGQRSAQAFGSGRQRVKRLGQAPSLRFVRSTLRTSACA